MGCHSWIWHIIHAGVSPVRNPQDYDSTFFGSICIICRWAAANGHWDEAARSIARISGLSQQQALDDPAIQEELEGIHREVESEKNMEKASFVDCFRGARKMRYRTLLGMSAFFKINCLGCMFRV